MSLMQRIYIVLFSILYLSVAAVSTIHALDFFGLANNSWMSVILAISFELGQAAVLFSLLTSKQERSKIMPWVLMTIFTLVQVLGNVYSSYKYILTHSPENLRFFKEPIFIWTELPDDQATVIVTYIVGAILPICALLLTSMVTNQFEHPNDTIIHLDEDDVQNNEVFKNNEQEQNIEHIEATTTTSTEKPKVIEKPTTTTSSSSTTSSTTSTSSTTTELPIINEEPEEVIDIIDDNDIEIKQDDEVKVERIDFTNFNSNDNQRNVSTTNRQSKFINFTDM
jgi:hypothetical protein